MFLLTDMRQACLAQSFLRLYHCLSHVLWILLSSQPSGLVVPSAMTNSRPRGTTNDVEAWTGKTIVCVLNSIHRFFFFALPSLVFFSFVMTQMANNRNSDLLCIYIYAKTDATETITLRHRVDDLTVSKLMTTDAVHITVPLALWFTARFYSKRGIRQKIISISMNFNKFK